MGGVRSLTGGWFMVLDAPDARELAGFYARLMGWSVRTEESGWVTLRPDEGNAFLAFQETADYVRPVWPGEDGKQRSMAHLDIGVTDLAAAVADAVELGAELAEVQPHDDIRVLFDPAGHPFCLTPVS